MRIPVSAIFAAAAMTLAGQGLPVTFERLLKADQEPGNWLMYSNTYDSWRFSRLDQINADNVKNLRVKWLFQGHQENVETTPLVVNNGRYPTRPENDGLPPHTDAARVVWTYSHT